MESLIAELLVYLIDTYLDCVDSLSNLKLVNKHYNNSIESLSKFNQFVRQCFECRRLKLNFKELNQFLYMKFKIESLVGSEDGYKTMNAKFTIEIENFEKSDYYKYLSTTFKLDISVELNNGLTLITGKDDNNNYKWIISTYDNSSVLNLKPKGLLS